MSNAQFLNNPNSIPFNDPNCVFNKACLGITSKLIDDSLGIQPNTIPTPTVSAPVVSGPVVSGPVVSIPNISANNINTPTQLGSGSLDTKLTTEVPNPYYNLFGYQISFWVLIILILVFMIIIYFVLRWIFISDEIVKVKKSKSHQVDFKKTQSLTNSKQNNSDSESNSDTDSDTDSDTESNSNTESDSKLMLTKPNLFTPLKI